MHARGDMCSSTLHSHGPWVAFQGASELAPEEPRVLSGE